MRIGVEFQLLFFLLHFWKIFFTSYLYLKNDLGLEKVGKNNFLLDI